MALAAQDTTALAEHKSQTLQTRFKEESALKDFSALRVLDSQLLALQVTPAPRMESQY